MYEFPPNVKIVLQPVTSIHLYSNAPDEPFANSDITYIYIFSLAALLILFIASVNYINFTTARSLERVKEVGVRKVLGAERKQLSAQFIGESFLFFGAAIPFAFVLAYLLWPVFNKILALELDPGYLISGKNILLIVAITLMSGLLSGLYPSLFLSHLQPAMILKDHQKSFKVNFTIRKILIVLQFVISVILIISTIVIYQQLNFIHSMPLGFNKEHLIVLPHNSFNHHANAFKNKLKENSRIEDVTIVSWQVGDAYGARSSMDDPKDSTRELKFVFLEGDFDFLQTMQIPLMEGRNFSPAYPSDLVNVDSILFSGKISPSDFTDILASRPIIITQKTASQLGLKNPVGEILRLGALQGTIVGLIKDFQGLSLHHETAPVVLRGQHEGQYGYTYVRIKPDNISKTVNYIQSVWKSFFPTKKFNFSFVAERLQKLYDSETRLASLFTFFAVVGICIACSGLFTLVALSVHQRTKEIGIRKVLGAGITEIVHLITSDFLLLTTVAIVIASPIAWYVMNKWLQNFAFRIDINWWVFVLAGVLAAGITFVTVGIQAVKASIANPAKSLRTE